MFFSFLCFYWQLQLLKTVIFWLVLKRLPRLNLKGFTRFVPQSKDRKSSYQIKEILPLFCKLGAPILG